MGAAPLRQLRAALQGRASRVSELRDFVLDNGVPTTSPEDFVTFKMREVRWKPWW